MVAVIGVSCVTRLGWRKHQPAATQNDVETVASHDIMAPVYNYHHQQKFVGTDARILLADVPNTLDDLTFMLHFLFNVALRLVESLVTVAK